jgi:hypothetical protein
MQPALLYFGSILIFIWGVGHLMPTRNVVAGFGRLSLDNTRVLTMEWLLEGLTLCFLGITVALVAYLTGPTGSGTIVVARTTGGMLIAMAVVSLFTGARTRLLPMKLCPVIKSVVAVAWVTATII